MQFCAKKFRQNFISVSWIFQENRKAAGEFSFAPKNSAKISSASLGFFKKIESQPMNFLLCQIHLCYRQKNANAFNFVSQFLEKKPFFGLNIKKPSFLDVFEKPPLFCSASLSLSDGDSGPETSQAKLGNGSGAVMEYRGDEPGAVIQTKNVSSSRAAEEERVLISEVFVRNKDGEELERKDLEAEALKASRANSALTVREVQEDVHRIIGSGYFMSCMPVAVDTRDGIRLIFQLAAVSLTFLLFDVCLRPRGQASIVSQILEHWKGAG